MAVICTKCGGTDVSCGAMVNPNTKEILHYTDEAFSYGWCEDCKIGVVLTDTCEIKQNVERLYNDWKSRFNGSPAMVSCCIVYKDETEEKEVEMKLSPRKRGDDDDHIFFYCNGLVNFLSLMDYGTEDFMVTSLRYFY